jgi:hypothetical protein
MENQASLKAMSPQATKSNTVQLLVTDNVVLIWLITSTLMMEAIRSSETPVLTRATWRYIPKDAILHSHCRENLKSHIALTGCAL